MSDPATIAGLPALLRAARLSVEEHAPDEGVAGFWRAALATTLFGVEMMADCLVAAIPEATEARHRPQQHQQSFYAPLRDRSPVVEEPLVPRRDGRDPRLPGNRPHP